MGTTAKPSKYKISFLIQLTKNVFLGMFILATKSN